MDMQKPGDAHKKLQKLAGLWKGQETMHPSPWTPQGGIATGIAENRVALDGFAVIQDYRQEAGGQVTYQGHGVFRYDPTENCYALDWLDSMGAPPNIFKGQFEGDTLVLTSAAHGGQTRATWKFGADGEYDYAMEVSGDGKTWQTFMDATYRKEG